MKIKPICNTNRHFSSESLQVRVSLYSPQLKQAYDLIGYEHRGYYLILGLEQICWASSLYRRILIILWRTGYSKSVWELVSAAAAASMSQSGEHGLVQVCSTEPCQQRAHTETCTVNPRGKTCVICLGHPALCTANWSLSQYSTEFVKVFKVVMFSF